MSPRLKISSAVRQRLLDADTEESTGCLYGLMYDGILLVVGFSLELTDEDGADERSAYSQLLLGFPAEVELCGVVRFGESLATENRLKEILQDVDITDNPLVMMVNEKRQMKAHFLVHDRFEETSYEQVSSEELWKQFVHIRLHTVLPLACEATMAGVKNALQAKRKKIASGQVSFHIDGTSVYMFGMAPDVGLTGTTGEPTIGQLIDSMCPEQPSKRKKISTNNVEVVPVNLVMKATKDILSEKLVKNAVKMVTTQGKPAYCISMPLVVDSLAMAHRDTKLVELYSVLVECACRSLRLLEHVLLEQLGQEGIGDGAGLRLPETYHFLPPELGHFYTRIVLKGVPDEMMERERRCLHEQFALSTKWPMFRRGNAYSLQKRSNLLLNPHEAMPPVPVKPDTMIAFVRGRYSYHHYMQNQFNDDGWGCAYRSLQTLCSWFRLQGYTTEPIPSHRDIQQCLVTIGDKPSSFLGSKQWIGSTEVSFVLETLLKVQSRIIFASSGAELQGYAPELLHHFRKHGSPIMIGGGVLAHTILGVECNTTTQETRYLILDPHYTGPEDLALILSKGWCGWKNSDFWNKTAHYNLCLPQTTPTV